MLASRFINPKSALALLGMLALLGVLLLAISSSGSAAPLVRAERQIRSGGPAIAPGAVVTNSWTNLFPDLLAVSAVSDSEVWAAGEYGHLLHYTGGSWTAVDPPLMRGVNLLSVSMIPTGGWIAAGDKAFRYDGTQWSEHSAGLGTSLSLKHVSALGLDDAWGTTAANCSSYSQLVHWDGSQWSAVLPSNSPYLLYDINMISPVDGWSAGQICGTGSGPVLLHYDGSNWTPLPGPVDSGLRSFDALALTGPNDIWATGNNQNNSLVYHFSAGTWTS